MKQPDLKWFHDQLRLEIEDRALERDGVSLDFYWDTSHIRQAALGMAALYDAAETFQADEFASDLTLICCLASKGWFGPMKLLQPHEAEFLKLIDTEFGVGAVGPPRGGAAKFVADSGLKGVQALNSVDLTRLGEEEVAGMVRAQAGSAAALFKVTYYSVGTWKTRIVRWRRENLLTPNEEVTRYGPIVESAEFQKLRTCFDIKRPTSGVNNFADAMAICLLAAQVRAYPQTHKIPRFFVSSSLYEDVLAETRLTHLLELRDGVRKSSVLRHSDYYMLRAMFHLPEDVKRTLPQGVRQLGESSDEELHETSQRISEILEAQRPLTDELLTTLSIGPVQLDDLIGELKQYWFLEKVWLPFAAQTQVVTAIREYVETARMLTNDQAFTEEVEKELRGTKEALARSSREFHRISGLFKAVQEATKRLRTMIDGAEPQTDLFKTFGLLRFGFTEDARKKIETFLQQLLETGLAGEGSLTRVVNIGEKARLNHAELAEVILLAASLWALHLDHQLIQLLEKNDHGQQSAIAGIFAAARLRSKRDANQVNQAWLATKNLERDYENIADPHKRLSLAIVLGYLYFHYWRAKIASVTTSGQRQYDSLIQSAISYAKAATELGEATEELEKFVYALNQSVYYMLHAPSDPPWTEIKATANRLLEYMDSGVWQYRFDDTLATYFEGRAHLALPADKMGHQQQALYHIERAWKEACGDEEIAKHRSRLQSDFGDIHGSG